jgi:hypothetical protein
MRPLSNKRKYKSVRSEGEIKKLLLPHAKLGPEVYYVMMCVQSFKGLLYSYRYRTLLFTVLQNQTNNYYCSIKIARTSLILSFTTQYLSLSQLSLHLQL